MRLSLVLTMLMAVTALSACGGAPLTYQEVRQTAAVTGCWPDPWPTPRPITVTPLGAPTLTPVGVTPIPGVPTLTPLPTTTAIPRCPPAPGATQRPWPTEVAALPPYPTMEPDLWQYGGGLTTIMELPDIILNTDLAVHPTEGWPVVGAIQWTGNSAPERAFVRVVNPEAGGWDVAQNVDLGPSGLGRRFRSLAVAITPDRNVHAAWASPEYPRIGGWASTSTDFGRTWSPPEQIAPGCLSILDLAASLDGRVVALAVCRVDDRSVGLEVITRGADGVWGAPERLSAPVWYASDGSVQVIGEGADARVVFLVTGDASRPATVYLFSRPLDGGSWAQVPRTLRLEGVGELPWHVRSTQFTRPDGAVGLLFAFGMREAPGVYSVASLDGGATWGEIVPVAIDGSAGSGLGLDRIVPAYDPGADRFAALWSCCADTMWGVAPATIYGSWSVPGAAWQPPQGPGERAPRIPLRLGLDNAVGNLVGAQVLNGRLVWLAWVEGSSRLIARALDLNQIIPVGEYPAPTSRPTAAGARP